MSDVGLCERNVNVEGFLSKHTIESAEIIVQNIPEEYRATYISTYAAGLVLRVENKHGEVQYA